MNGKHFTIEELRLLKTNTPIAELIHHPAFKNRSINGMHSKRRELLAREPAREKVKKERKPRSSDYDGRKVKLYQFISIAEATPERVKQWTK